MGDKKISGLGIIPEIVDEDYIQIIDADEIDPSLRNKRVLIPLLREYLTMPVDTVKLQSIAQGDWIAGGTSGFYFDITHTLGTKDLFWSVYDITGGKYDGYELAQYLPQSDTVYRVESSINTVDVIVLLSTGGSSVVVGGAGSMDFKKDWNADTNTPLVDLSDNNNGDVYKVNVAGWSSPNELPTIVGDETVLIASGLANASFNGTYIRSTFNGRTTDTAVEEDSNYWIWKKDAGGGVWHVLTQRTANSSWVFSEDKGLGDPDTWTDGLAWGQFSNPFTGLFPASETLDGKQTQSSSASEIDYITPVYWEIGESIIWNEDSLLWEVFVASTTLTNAETAIYSGTKTKIYAATIDIDCSERDNFQITLTGALTLSANSFEDGQVIAIDVIQDGTGSHVLTLDGVDFTPYSNINALDTTANAINTIIGRVINGTIYYMIQTV